MVGQSVSVAAVSARTGAARAGEARATEKGLGAALKWRGEQFKK
jgi:hypothetical protein